MFAAAIVAETAVLACFLFTPISFLWYNVIGCLAVILLALVFEGTLEGRARQRAPERV